MLTLFKPGGELTKTKWIPSKLFKLPVWPPNLVTFPYKLSGNILKLSWRVHQHLRYHGKTVLTAFFFLQFAFFLQKRIISIFTYWIIVLLFSNILSNIFLTIKSNTRFTLYLGIFHFEGTNNVAICILLKNLTIWRHNDIKLRQYVHQI